ncbi:hypothetical protein V2J09_020864, partial [Rumex salicifolius]
FFWVFLFFTTLLNVHPNKRDRNRILGCTFEFARALAMASPNPIFFIKFSISKSSLASPFFTSFFFSKSPMDLNPRNSRSFQRSSFSTSCSLSPPLRESQSRELPSDYAITLEEWQGWGPTTPVPTIVTDAIAYLKEVEATSDAQMSFGGNGGRFQGDFKHQEDKKHRATYQSLSDSESKFQFFSARQIACRLLGSRGYLFREDCMCTKITPRSLWKGMRFWVYMHPKDFLRQNNTGKLMWQLFGVHSATLCLFGITEQEDMMWNEFRNAGKGNVWCLYPSKSTEPKTVDDCFSQDTLLLQESSSVLQANGTDTLNFILIDGTWNNSAAMVRRLKDRAKLVWGEDDIACISLNTGASAMHRLRPQPSWDRTCTAGAAAGLLSELHLLPRFSLYGLDKEADIIEDTVEILLGALTARRVRTGRSITRKVRGGTNIF